MQDFRIDLIRTWIQIAVAALGDCLGYFRGGMDGLLIALIILMALDYKQQSTLPPSGLTATLISGSGIKRTPPIAPV